MTFLFNLMQHMSTNDHFYHMSAFMFWPRIQAAAPMAPKVITIIHTPNTRQGVNTQVREIPLFPTDSMTAQCLVNTHEFIQVWFFKKRTKWFKRKPNSCFILKYNILVFIFLNLLSIWQHAETATTKCLISVHSPKVGDRIFAGKDWGVQMTLIGSIV